MTRVSIWSVVAASVSGRSDGIVVKEELPVEAAGHALVAEGDEGVIDQFFQGQVLACQCGEGPAAHQNLVKGHQIHHFQAPTQASAGVEMTAKSTSPFFTACTACGVEWLEMRSRMPGYSVWKARSFSDR